VRSRDGLATRTAKAGVILAMVCALGGAPALAQGPDPAPPHSAPQPDPAPGAHPTTPPPAPPVTQAPAPPVTQAPAPPVTHAPVAPAPTTTAPQPVATATPAARQQPAAGRQPRPTRRAPHRAARRHRDQSADPAPQLHRVTAVPSTTPPLAEGLFRPLAGTPRAHPHSRDGMLVGSALAMLAVAASTLLLLAQANRIRRELRPS
jgi:outer membrane biosynthesis protein TonB